MGTLFELRARAGSAQADNSAATPQLHRRHQNLPGITFLCLLFVCAVLVAPLAGAQTIASAHIGTASLISPTAAESYYTSLPGATTSTNGLGLTARPNEIKELA